MAESKSKKQTTIVKTEVAETTETVENTEPKVEETQETIVSETDTKQVTAPFASEDQSSGFTTKQVNLAQQVNTMETVKLYNRNPFPVVLQLTDGSELVLSPNQRSEPINKSLIAELPAGVLQG